MVGRCGVGATGRGWARAHRSAQPVASAATPRLHVYSHLTPLAACLLVDGGGEAAHEFEHQVGGRPKGQPHRQAAKAQLERRHDDVGNDRARAAGAARGAEGLDDRQENGEQGEGRCVIQQGLA